MTIYDANSIYNATLTGPVFAMIGENQVHSIGRIVYRFKRPEPFPNGMAQTLPTFAKGTPHLWVDGKFVPTQDHAVIRPWSDKITLVS